MPPRLHHYAHRLFVPHPDVTSLIQRYFEMKKSPLGLLSSKRWECGLWSCHLESITQGWRWWWKETILKCKLNTNSPFKTSVFCLSGFSNQVLKLTATENHSNFSFSIFLFFFRKATRKTLVHSLPLGKRRRWTVRLRFVTHWTLKMWILIWLLSK